MGIDISQIKNDKLVGQIRNKVASQKDERNYTTEKQIIQVPIIAPGLNGDDGLQREHWTSYEKRLDNYTAIIKGQNLKPYKGCVAMKYERHSVQLMDWDNLGASFKCWGDALIKAGIIEDDSPKIITEFDMYPVKANSYRDVGTTIIIRKA